MLDENVWFIFLGQGIPHLLNKNSLSYLRSGDIFVNNLLFWDICPLKKVLYLKRYHEHQRPLWSAGSRALLKVKQAKIFVYFSVSEFETEYDRVQKVRNQYFFTETPKVKLLSVKGEIFIYNWFKHILLIPVNWEDGFANKL